MDYLDKIEKGKLTVYHNGCNALSCSSGKEAVDYIGYILDLSLDRDPENIIAEILDTPTSTGGKYILLVYEYKADRCREFFMVEFN